MSSFFRGVKSIVLRLFSFLKQLTSTMPGKVKRYILTALMFLLALVSFLSFFELSGKGGETMKLFIFNLFGDAAYLAPLIFIFLAAVSLFVPKKLFLTAFLAICSFLIGISGLFMVLTVSFLSGGQVGKLGSGPLINIFGRIVSLLVFWIMVIVGGLSFWYVLNFSSKKEEQQSFPQAIKKMFNSSRFRVVRVEPESTMRRKEGLLEGARQKTEVLRPKDSKINFPPFNLLEEEKEKPHPGDIKQNSRNIKKTLENFGIEVTMAEVNVGPTVSQYALKPADGVKLSRITGLSNNLALALAAHPIRIEAPIPGRSLVGIEIPNTSRSKVRLRNLISDRNFRRDTSSLGFVLGRDVAGNPVSTDLSHLPHLLVAGATGAGKTIFLNSLILSLLYRNSPETLRLILIDPKRVEFSLYGELPHLLNSVIFGAQKSVNALNWLVDEMEKRFTILSEAGVRDIGLFNKRAIEAKEKPLYYIVLVIDELADLMAARGKEIEVRIVRIAQMARAVGIHLVLATQRPSTEVITGLIKANIISRISFQLPTQIDSRTVLDSAGAEKLLGLGDMLYVSAESVKPKRIQGAYVSEKEVADVVKWITNHIGPSAFLDDASLQLQDYISRADSGPEGIQGMKKEALYEQAKEVVIRSRKASASLLQRRLQIGYVRAARLLDMLEAEGVVGPAQGAKPRKVFFEQTQQDSDYHEF